MSSESRTRPVDEESAVEANGDDMLLNPPAVRQTLDLIRPWIDHLPPHQRRLGGFIFLSLLVHLVAFFSLRIDTTRTAEPHFPHLQISMGTGPSDQYWDALNDPRVFVLPPKSSSQQISHADSFSPESWKADSLPEPATNTSPITPLGSTTPVQIAKSELTWDRLPLNYEPPPIRSAKVTTWVFDKTLDARKPSVMANLMSPTSNTVLVPTELSVGIDSDGNVQHVLVEQSCGKSDLDHIAVQSLRHYRFQSIEPADIKTSSEVQWGHASVFWSFRPEPIENAIPIDVPTEGT